MSSPRITTVDPATGQKIAEYPFMTPEEVGATLAQNQRALNEWRRLPLAARVERFRRLGYLLEEDRDKLAVVATLEMGKPHREAVKELQKCAATCHWYADHAERLLSSEAVALSADSEAIVSLAPLGAILAIMPWNFPYWQVIRAAVPTLLVGNVVLLKHAENTTGAALTLEQLFLSAGFPQGALSVLCISVQEIPSIIRLDQIRGVTLTGSERAGKSVAAVAGDAIKKCVLELGGSDPYIVLADADWEQAAKTCVAARFQNAGQSCVAAKRFLVEAPIYERFLAAFCAATQALQVGDPRDPHTEVGPMARSDLRAMLASQIEASRHLGATVALAGGSTSGPGFFFRPMVLTDVRPGMRVFDEETFGPVAVVCKVPDAASALAMANKTSFGLGAAIFTSDLDRAQRLAQDEINSGMIAINGMVASDPRLPFGGIGRSGFGRELSNFGLQEFANVKTIVRPRMA